MQHLLTGMDCSNSVKKRVSVDCSGVAEVKKKQHGAGCNACCATDEAMKPTSLRTCSLRNVVDAESTDALWRGASDEELLSFIGHLVDDFEKLTFECDELFYAGLPDARPFGDQDDVRMPIVELRRVVKRLANHLGCRDPETLGNFDVLCNSVEQKKQGWHRSCRFQRNHFIMSSTNTSPLGVFTLVDEKW